MYHLNPFKVSNLITLSTCRMLGDRHSCLSTTNRNYPFSNKHPIFSLYESAFSKYFI